MAATSELRATFNFDDGTNYVYSMGPFRPAGAAVAGFKTRVMSANQNSSFDSEAFISSEDSFCKGITAAEIVTSDRTVLFAKSAALRAQADRGDFNDEQN